MLSYFVDSVYFFGLLKVEQYFMNYVVCGDCVQPGSYLNLYPFLISIFKHLDGSDLLKMIPLLAFRYQIISFGSFDVISFKFLKFMHAYLVLGHVALCLRVPEMKIYI